MTNFNQFLKQAHSMQKKMQAMQKKMANAEYFGKAGGGLVNITVSGRGEVRKVSIDSSLLKETEKELLEDLVVAAFNDAKSKIDEDSQNSMSDALLLCFMLYWFATWTKDAILNPPNFRIEDLLHEP